MKNKGKRFLPLALAGILFTGTISASALDGVDTDYYSQYQGQGISLNVYNWGEYISDGSDDSINVNQEFEELTGIKVNYTTFATNEELYAKLQSGAVNYDIIIPSDYMIARMIREDMLEKLDFSKIPAFDNIDPEYHNLEYDPENAYSVPYTWGTVGIIYNTSLVSDPVDSWDMLWNEKYKGNILMFSNPRDAFGISLKRLGYSFNTGNEEEIRRAFEELKKQKPLVQAYVMDEIFDKMQSGEAAIAPYYAGDAITMIEDNPALAFASPKEGVNRFVDAICIPKGAQNTEAAHLYINFLCEPEIAAANIDYIGYSTPNQAAFGLLDEELQNNPIAYPAQAVLDKSELFLVLPNEVNQLVDQLWTQLLSSKDQSSNSSAVFWVVVVIALIALGAVYMLVRKRRNAADEDDE